MNVHQSAFPEVGQEWNPDRQTMEVASSGGMTLLVYAALRAPAEPQNWFRPVMPSPYPPLPEIKTIRSSRVRRDVETAMEADTDPTTREGKDFMKRYQAAVKAGNEWLAEEQRQRYIQWPRAWAEAVLETLA